MFESDAINLLGYLAVFFVFVVVFTLEVIAPASGNPCDKRWRIYAGFINLFQITILVSAGVLFRDWFEQNSLITLPSTIPLVASAFLIFFCSSFLAYWWHRATHKFDGLWRVFHQLHHSPSRIESLTAFYVHPFDGLAALCLNFIVAFWVFGAEANVATLAIVIAAIYNIYVHSDTRSPKWLGYFVQRPEMHQVHHRQNYHKQNYGLPVWDLLFGTFENPTAVDFSCGFSDEKQLQIKEMLLLKDIDG